MIQRFSAGRLSRLSLGFYLLGLIASFRPLSAQVYELKFSGSINTAGQTFLGNSGPAVPVKFSFSYDFSQGAPTKVFSAGTQTTGGITQTDWYRYENLGLIATSLQIGGTTLVPTFSDRIPVSGVTGGQLWLNADMRSSVPTAYWMYGSSGSLSVSVGGASSGNGFLVMQSNLVLEDPFTFPPSFFPVSVSSVTASAVPEPEVWGLFSGLAGAGWAVWLRRRQR